jgi:hypothetical protein
VTLDPCLVMCCPCKGVCLDRNIPDISNPHHLHTDKKIKEYKKKFSFRKKIGIKAINRLVLRHGSVTVFLVFFFVVHVMSFITV